MIRPASTRSRAVNIPGLMGIKAWFAASILLRFLVFSAMIFMSPGLVRAAQVTLSWETDNSAPEGYRLFQRMDGDRYDYTKPVWTGSDTTCTISNIPNDTTCFFVIRAYEGSVESDDSNEVVFSSVAAVYDGDGDGMPDAWETTHGLDPLSDDAGLDPDGDGLSNLAEYQTGSDPNVGDANRPPDQPQVILGEDDPAGVPLTPWFYSSEFFDPDTDDIHARTQWRILESDTLREVFNRTSADRSLVNLHLPRLVLDPDTDYICEMRHFDQHNMASDWSFAVSFTTVGLGNDTNNNGVADTREQVIYSDLNGDGITDNEQANIVRSVENPTSKKVAGISIEASPDVESIIYGLALDSEMLDPDIDTFQATDYGVIGYKLQLTGIGQSVDVVLYFQEAIETSTSWACINSTFEIENCTDAVDWSDPGYAAVRSLTDGGEGDADGVANGVIVDFVAPASMDNSSNISALSSSYSADAGAAAGAGCFITSLFQ